MDSASENGWQRTTQAGGLSLSQPSACRPLPVRLCDIKPLVRLTAARTVAQREPGWAQAVLHAALHPSSTTYWVNDDALPILLKVAA